jgi:hypothetical protein
MKLIHNVSNNCFTNIEGFRQLYIGEGQKGLQNTFAVVVHLDNKAVAPLAFFSDEEEAKECLDDIVLFMAKELDTDIMTVKDNVKESLLIAPDSTKDKIKRVK